jgi:hypothetical protein
MKLSQVKQRVASRNVTFKTEDIKLCDYKFDKMKENGARCVIM